MLEDKKKIEISNKLKEVWENLILWDSVHRKVDIEAKYAKSKFGIMIHELVGDIPLAVEIDSDGKIVCAYRADDLDKNDREELDNKAKKTFSAFDNRVKVNYTVG